MEKIKNIFKSKYLRYALLLLIGLFVGWLIFGGSSSGHDESEHKEVVENQVWTCSMHPQIKQDKPGKCPICAMDLIPLRTGGSSDIADDGAIELSEEAAALANVQTSVVSRERPIKEVSLYGTIQPDERSLQSQTAHVGGRIEKLYVDFTGESVRQGATIATIYSPDLLNAQQELLEAIKLKETQPRLVEAAKEKLRLWKLTDEQIYKIETSGNVSPNIDIKANTSGIVISKKVSQGDYITAGSVLFDIANLSRVWAMFDAYEVDLPFLKVGDKLEFTLQAIPGKKFSGNISFIDPIIDKTTRTAKVRVETSNPGMELKPEMYASAIVNAPLKQLKNEIVIPKTAILWTGKRSIVYVKQANSNSPIFKLREIELGPSLGDSYVVLEGLTEGERIVTNGVFSIDASAQLEGKRSMMNNEASQPMTGHEGHDMSGGTSSKSNAKTEHAAINVNGSCEMCKERIETAAKTIAGVTTATWDQNAKQLHVNFESSKTSIDAISKAMAKVGHDTDKYKADQATYNALPDCCKYR
ncbi:Multidrug resistance protein MdtA [bioreactor metagenome]|jgi:Cu(I)/Ag(I) efflux system membrane fusion protein|uniref:Multidrug resistance protein MdtA n=1 Tax=bioreactor metagenome TaxID=1076179 RepID=A0A644WJ11_9ZZZZ